MSVGTCLIIPFFDDTYSLRIGSGTCVVFIADAAASEGRMHGFKRERLQLKVRPSLARLDLFLQLITMVILRVTSAFTREIRSDLVLICSAATLSRLSDPLLPYHERCLPIASNACIRGLESSSFSCMSVLDKCLALMTALLTQQPKHEISTEDCMFQSTCS
jgi:hypothetical protein